MAKTKKPTGLTITRNGNKFIVTWKIGDKDYSGGQTVKYKKKGAKKYTTVSGVGKKTTKVTITANGTTTVMIRGKRSGYTVSDWAKVTFTVQKPKIPTVVADLVDNETNVCEFSWVVAETSLTSKFWFTGVEWDAMLVQDNTVTNGAELVWDSNTAIDWKHGTSGSGNSSTEITEDTSILATGNFTRWFRIKSKGKAGDSGYKYARHAYAQPKQAEIRSATGQKNNAGGTNVQIVWVADSSEAQPIDLTTVQYIVTNPAAGLTCPAGVTGWNDVNSFRDTANEDAISVAINDQAGENECMFVRVNTEHDENTPVTSAPALVEGGGIGYLSTPSGLSVTLIDQSAHVVSVAATNTAENDIEDSFLVVRFTSEIDTEGFDIAVIAHGDSSVQIQCPDWGTGAYSFSVYAAVGSYVTTTRADGITSYAVTARMQSALISSGGAVPLAPANVALSQTDKVGTIQVTWDWSWGQADSVELSWADHDDAWESTDEPSTFMINNTYVSRWNIAGLETGKVWYVRVRLCVNNDGVMTYGAYSQTVAINLSSAPSIPNLTLSQSVITTEGSFTASWGYSTTDGTAQSYAELDEVTVEGGQLVYTPVAKVQTAQHVTLTAAELGWNAGERHGLAVYVVSASGQRSNAWSDTRYIDVAEPLTINISQSSLVDMTITDPDETTRTVKALREMPFTITVEGAGASGRTVVAIERAEPYYLVRPDETEFNGYEGETIALTDPQDGEAQITITSDDDNLIGYLDDGASYRVVATVYDDIGQSASTSIDFEVHWLHQAEEPTATVTINDGIAILRPIAPEGVETGDVCDIYRLSVDKPELIYEDAEWGTDYVDPYPTIGDYGGYRFVLRTANGDFITEDNTFALYDVNESLEVDGYNIIDFGTGRVMLNRNIDLSSSWEKDFQETKYLGGSVQGDWNPAVSRSSEVSAVAVTIMDSETIQAMRDLAVYSGICHVRTCDGSNYTADVQVSEDYSHDTGQMVAEFTLNITKVDPEELDGMTYAEWLQTQEE